MDVSLTELACVRASLWIGISVQSDEALPSDDDCKITFLHQCGGGALEMESIDEMIHCATRTAFELNTSFKKRLAEIEWGESSMVSTFLT
uniref:RNase_PH_C domain-containing protein n=1 Tax=Syphacia muris TaxID=451379 RepID=A0A0N5AZ05_9BILA